jgi:hypothetical protein
MLKQTGMDREPQRSDQTPDQRQPLSLKPWSIIRNAPNYPKRSPGALSTNQLHVVAYMGERNVWIVMKIST